MPQRLPFKDSELGEYYEITEGTLADLGGFPYLNLKCKICPKGKPAREYELELDPDTGSIRTGDRNALLAHGRAHSIKPTLRRKIK